MPESHKGVVNGTDDSAYGGQKFDVEKSKLADDAAAPELQLNRKGLGKSLYLSKYNDFGLHYECFWFIQLSQN